MKKILLINGFYIETQKDRQTKEDNRKRQTTKANTK